MVLETTNKISRNMEAVAKENLEPGSKSGTPPPGLNKLGYGIWMFVLVTVLIVFLVLIYRSEIEKLQRNIDLLQDEYNKLQNRESEHNNVMDHGLGQQLYKMVSNMCATNLFSDMMIQLKDEKIPGHQLVFAARNIQAENGVLDWENIAQDIGRAIVKYIYTDQIDLSSPEEVQLQIMRTGHRLNLTALVEKCESSLILVTSVKNCVSFYMTAEEVAAASLKHHASSLISTYWDELTSEDFKEMGAPLLYSMLKEKTAGSILHSAVHLHREDVVFLYLVENSAQLQSLVNSADSNGDLALDIALRDKQIGIAETLIKHKADVNAKDGRGWSLLLKATGRGDLTAAKFLLDHDTSISTTTPDTMDTALHLIAMGNHQGLIPVAKVLLERGLSPDLQNRAGATPLHLSLSSHNEEMFDLLLSRPVDLSVTDVKGHPPLYYACLKLTDEASSVRSFAARLLDKGTNSNPVYDNGSTLLHQLVAEGREYPAIFLCPHASNLDHQDQRGFTALHLAAQNGMLNLVTQLIKCGANINVQTSLALSSGDQEERYKLTPLHCAILGSNPDQVVDILLQEKDKLNVNLLDSRGDSPLSLALWEGTPALVPGLVRAGADLNLRDIDGRTLLHQAIMKRDTRTTLTLIQSNADIDARTVDQKSPLDLCLCDDSLEPVVEALCQRGVDMSTGCPLWACLENGNEVIAKVLVRYGVDTDEWNEGPDGCLQTLLHRAIDENNEPAALFLIQSGCDLSSARRPGPGGRGGEEARDSQGPLHLCCQWGLENVVQALMEKGAPLNAQDSEGRTPLHIAISNGHPTLINLLLLHPDIDLSLRDRTGASPFHTALSVRNNEAARRILELNSAAAEQFDSRGKNFLHLAIQKGDIESVLFLLSVSVDVNSRVQDSTQNTPLHLAATQPNDLLVRNLLLAGARIDERNSHKQTALHIATETGNTEVIAALVQNGCDYNAVDSEGDNALHIACREGHVSAVSTLLSESQIDADAPNLRFRTPLHVLAHHSKESAPQIAELFVGAMPTGYNLDRRDADGNTALMLAYMKGNGALCRTLAKNHACVGAMNKHGVTIFNYQVATKTLLHRLLDSLAEEPPWAEGDVCLECGTKFGLTMRKHHCRHCGRLLCSKCSSQEVPILKFNLAKPVRVCEVCVNVISGVVR
uniref:Rabankyrin-5 n=2 Tax=Cacopsylla melanoneura TaxID=428564 RepID=A0A8D8RKA9_9HEMI